MKEPSRRGRLFSCTRKSRIVPGCEIGFSDGKKRKRQKSKEKKEVNIKANGKNKTERGSKSEYARKRSVYGEKTTIA